MTAETMEKTESGGRGRRNSIFLALILLAVFGAGWLVQHYMLGNSGPMAVVQYNGEIIHELPLNRETSVVVGDRDGDYNIVTVKNGKVSVTEANCPDQICVQIGQISSVEEVIACLPHGMIVYIEEEG